MKARASATASSVMSSVAPCCSISSMPRSTTWQRPIQIIRGEVEAYGAGLEDKPEIIALSKADAAPKDDMKKKARALKKAAGVAPLIVSAASGEGINEALRALVPEIKAMARRRQEAARGGGGAAQGGVHEGRMVERQTPCDQDRLVAPGRCGVGNAQPSLARSARR